MNQYFDYYDAGTTFEAYVTHPPGLTAPAPCVLLTHDWSGPNDAMRAATTALSEQGYVGFALDAYGKGVRGSLTGDNSALMNPLMQDRALLRRRLLAGLAAAQQHPMVDPARIAVVGYCFGGLCAMDLARAAPAGLKGAVSIHGGLTPPRIGPQVPIPASILVLHGWEDRYAPTQDLLALTDELTAAGADWQVHAYGHAQHAFTFKGANFPERGIVYNAKADRRSWASLQAFLSEVLA